MVIKKTETDIYQERYLKHQKRKKEMLVGGNKTNYTLGEIDALFDVLGNRRSQRIFNKERINTLIVDDILTAASLAPSSCDRKAIIVKEVRSKKEIERLSHLLVGGAGWLQNAATVLLLLADMLAYKSPNEVDFMPYLDTGFVAENIYLASEALGIGVCFVNPNIRKENKKEFIEMFGEENHRFCGAMALGNYDNPLTFE